MWLSLLQQLNNLVCQYAVSVRMCRNANSLQCSMCDLCLISLQHYGSSAQKVCYELPSILGTKGIKLMCLLMIAFWCELCVCVCVRVCVCVHRPGC
jgi:hypothetical protein